MRSISISGLAIALLFACTGQQVQQHHAPVSTTPVDATSGSAGSKTPLQDRDQPEYWVERLVDPNQQTECVQKLTQIFETSVAHANGDVTAKAPQALIDSVVVPLTDAYIRNYVVFSRSARANLLKLLSRFNDPRAEPAFKKAISAYLELVPTDRESLDLKWAAMGVGELRLQSCFDSLFEAFLRMRASTMLGGASFRAISNALDRIPQASWAPRLYKVLDVPIEIPTNRDGIDAYKDQLFWQVTAVHLLGLLRDPTAVEPLLRVMLDPAKVDIQSTALFALVKIGRPALERSMRLLHGEEAALQKFNVERIASSNHGQKWLVPGETHKRVAALVLGTIGRREAATSLILALGRSQNDATRAVLARELTKLPCSQEAVAAFKKAFEALQPHVRMPPDVVALAQLAESAVQFHDPKLLPWLLSQARRISGTDDTSLEIRASVRLAMLKLAEPGELELLRQAYQKQGSADEKARLALVESMLLQCRDQLDCYFAEVTKPENQTEQRQIVAMKAAITIGAIGNEAASSRLVDLLGHVPNAAVRFMVAGSIDHLLARGSTEVADRLARVIETNEQTNDRQLIASDAPLKQTMYRIRTRAQ